MQPLPLKANGYVKTRLVPLRSSKDPYVTLEGIKARAQYFGVLGEKRRQRLEEPSLISSLHGSLDGILFTIPSWVFFSGLTPEEDVLIEKYAAVFWHLLGSMPGHTKVTLLTHDASKDLANDWIVALRMEERVEVVTAPDSLNFTVWAEDAYCVSEDMSDGETYFVEPASFSRGDDAYIADLVSAQSDFERTQAILYFQGGNILIGDTFWIIGADYPTKSMNLGFIATKPCETEAEAIARTYGASLDQRRELIVLGSRLPVPVQDSRPFQLNGEDWEEVLYSGNNDGTVQPLFHIDMFVSLVGLDNNGDYVVLVGSPELAAQLLGEPLPVGAMQAVFNDIASQLVELGFRVIRNPLPMAYDDDDEKRARYWYFATGNNVILQDEPRKVWLPTYGHGNWSKLKRTDDENQRIWESLGYTVELLPDFHPFAANLGAAHCISKYLGRSHTAP